MNVKNYPLHPGQDHVPPYYVQVPQSEYESLKRENAELKAKLESVQATAYAESVDAGMENRKLKRALYKACVNWMTNRQCAMRCYDLEARAKKFDKAIAKCRAKAEEYQ